MTKTAHCKNALRYHMIPIFFETPRVSLPNFITYSVHKNKDTSNALRVRAHQLLTYRTEIPTHPTLPMSPLPFESSHCQPEQSNRLFASQSNSHFLRASHTCRLVLFNSLGKVGISLWTQQCNIFGINFKSPSKNPRSLVGPYTF